jgi:hypothetical protein
MARFLLSVLVLMLSACGSPPRTQDRMPPERMQELVAAPLAYARAGNLPRAQREFEALLERSGHEMRADLLTAFGVTLFTLDVDEEAAGIRLRRAALPYLQRAIPATAERFGNEHPEVALALNTYGDALREVSPGDPPRQVDEAYEEAHRIRVDALGPRNPETVYALLRLAQVRGLPSRVAGDSARIAEVGRMYDEVIRGLEFNRDPNSPQPEQVRSEKLQMLERNGWVRRSGP